MTRPATNNGTSVTQNKLVCANVLLSRFADVNVANDDGDTPLIAGYYQINCQLTFIFTKQIKLNLLGVSSSELILRS